MNEYCKAEVGEDCISRANLIKSFLADCECESREEARAVMLNLEDILKFIEEAPNVIPKTKEVIYGNEHNCIMTLFGECSYSETGCGDCTVVKIVRDALELKEGEWIIHKINGIPHTVECSHCHQHYDYEELRHLGRSKGCIDIPHCPNCGAKMKGAEE